ncbi:MAG: hypothetical protein WA324_08535 [Bryobacteraceae bacterium]
MERRTVRVRINRELLNSLDWWKHNPKRLAICNRDYHAEKQRRLMEFTPEWVTILLPPEEPPEPWECGTKLVWAGGDDVSESRKAAGVDTCRFGYLLCEHMIEID